MGGVRSDGKVRRGLLLHVRLGKRGHLVEIELGQLPEQLLSPGIIEFVDMGQDMALPDRVELAAKGVEVRLTHGDTLSRRRHATTSGRPVA